MKPPATPVDATAEARKQLDWLKLVGAVRSIEVDESGEFVVELPDRKLLALDIDQVPVFRAGVLAVWRLPRAEAPR